MIFEAALIEYFISTMDRLIKYNVKLILLLTDPQRNFTNNSAVPLSSSGEF